MNRYAAAGLAEAARQGRRILVVSGGYREAEHALADFDGLADDARTIIRTNGAQRIDWPSRGTVRFASVRSNRERGLSVDTVYLDAEVAHDHDLIDRYWPCIQASPSGTVVRA